MNKKAVFLLGDSITQGLGSKKINFTGELGHLLGEPYTIVNLAHTGSTIDYAINLLNEGKVPGRPGDLCVILYGNVDAQIRPNSKGRVFPYIPKRYQGDGMLMPRPFFSKSALKKAGQHIDNCQRKFYASLIKFFDGTEQWMPIEAFVSQYSELLDRLTRLGVRIIPCTCVYIDEKLFPKCPEQFELYNKEIKRLAEERALGFIDFYSLFKLKVGESGWESFYNKDHFHPNGEGYKLMAKRIADEIKI